MKAPQRNLIKFIILLVLGIAALTLIDVFAFKILQGFSLVTSYIPLVSFLVIVVIIIITTKYSTRIYGIMISALLVFYEVAYGQILFIESTGTNPDIWPPVYILSIIIFTFLGYLFGKLITSFIKHR